jgi:hypothetical protein
MVYIKPIQFDVIFQSPGSTLKEPRHAIVLSFAHIVGPSPSARCCIKYLEYLYEKLVFSNLYLHTMSLGPGIKRPGREADHSPPTSAEVKNT